MLYQCFACTDNCEYCFCSFFFVSIDREYQTVPYWDAQAGYCSRHATICSVWALMTSFGCLDRSLSHDRNDKVDTLAG